MRGAYQREMLALRHGFEAGATGAATGAARSDAVDRLVAGLWGEAVASRPELGQGIALLAVGGYGRHELFPYSDIDLLFLLDARQDEAACKDPIRRMSQELWDCGLRVSTMTRRLAECERLDPANVEAALTLLDARWIAGDAVVGKTLLEKTIPKLMERDGSAMARRLAEITAMRHRKWGNTLFHLEPNIKECPGGLRDVHVCGWMARLKDGVSDRDDDAEFEQAVEFLFRLRCFLHYRHERDDNMLDWQAQDAAAAAGIGVGRGQDSAAMDAAYWMRHYFRHARVVERRAAQGVEETPGPSLGRLARSTGLRPRQSGARAKAAEIARRQRFRVEYGAVVLDAATEALGDPAHDPEVVLAMFAAMAEQGFRLGREAERRLSQALPYLSTELEEGPGLWRHLAAILCGHHAGDALRTMHVLGLLELLIPEFHGIDALVIRDAYHRYTVDEHTFVLIDTLHGLEEAVTAEGRQRAAAETQPSAMAEWSARFGQLLRDLQQPALLYLVALLHDTGKGRSTGDHTLESARLAESVLDRLELDAYERGIVLGLIVGHLEMSAALRRDIFDVETVRAFAAKVQTHEALRMLALFTYADIQAVHPDALTPWKAENLWRLYVATSNDLDRSVDEERLDGRGANELVERVAAGVSRQRAELEAFLLGLPERYLRTRTPEQVRRHFEGALRLVDEPVQLEFHYSPNVNEMTLLSRDRPRLFATMAGALAAWGMNIVTADAFSNQQGVVVDMFRFTDAFRTLEMNVSERERFVASVREVVAGTTALEILLHGRRRGLRRPPMVKVEARVDFDDRASSHSTLMQVMAQDTSGLLYAISGVLADAGLNVDVALIDTEGEMAIDVFYLTKQAKKLDATEQESLRVTLLEAINVHSR